MQSYSTRQAAKKLGLHLATLARYVQQGKVPPPTTLKVGSASLHSWTEADIERVRELLPRIADGRKTRHQKKQLATGKQPAKANTKEIKPPPGTAAPHKKK